MSETAMEWFFGEPPCAGWYFYSPLPQDWDLAKPIGVSRHEYGDGSVKFFAQYQGTQVDCEFLKDGIWCGPIPSMGKPPKWMQDKRAKDVT